MATSDIYEPIPEYFKTSLPTPAGNVGPSSFASNLGGLLFGGADSGLSEYLSSEQQKQMQSQALMSAAMSLLKNSGYTTRPIGFGEALGSAYEAGQQGYQGAQTNAINQLITKQKLDEAKRAQQAQLNYQNLLTNQPTVGGEITPQQAISMPGMALGPTVERADLIGQPAPSVAPSGMNVLTPMQRAMLSTLPAEKGIPEILKLTQPTEKSRLLAELNMQPTLANLRLLDKPEADPEKIRILKALNMDVTLTNLRQLDKPESAPNEVQLLNAAGVPVTLENIMNLKRSGATNVTQNAEKQGVTLATTQAIKNLDESRMMAQSANATLSNIDRILPALDTAIVGPAADTRTTLLRIGKQLNIGGANADQILRSTATVVQGLAQQELDAASQMRGQGALTEGERAILRRAAGGDQSLTSGELQQGLIAAQRSARARLSSHQDLLNKATTAIPSLSTIAPMYEVQPYGAQPPNQLQNAVQQEIDRRRASGGRR